MGNIQDPLFRHALTYLKNVFPSLLGKCATSKVASCNEIEYIAGSTLRGSKYFNRSTPSAELNSASDIIVQSTSVLQCCKMPNYFGRRGITAVWRCVGVVNMGLFHRSLFLIKRKVGWMSYVSTKSRPSFGGDHTTAGAVLYFRRW